jgi:hypothetical protein
MAQEKTLPQLDYVADAARSQSISTANFPIESLAVVINGQCLALDP